MHAGTFLQLLLQADSEAKEEGSEGGGGVAEGGSPPSFSTGLAHERAWLGVRGNEEAIAAAGLLWRHMTVASAGHARLRYTLCEVWRVLYGEAQPGCLVGFPQPISYEHVLRGYEPLQTILARLGVGSGLGLGVVTSRVRVRRGYEPLNVILAC